MFQDYLLYATDVEVRYAFRMLHLSDLVANAKVMHGLSDGRATLLGESLLGGTLLASILEDEERINLRVHSGSDFTVGVETTRHAETRGYLECNDSSPIVAALDAGLPFQTHLQVRTLRSKAKTPQLFEGMSQSDTQSIETALNEHLAVSYQMKARIKLDAWIDPGDKKIRAFGVIYLELPKLDADVADRLWDHVAQLGSLRQIFSRSDDPDRLAAALIPDLVRPINSVNPKWSCTCSQDSVEQMLLKLPTEELADMIQSDEPADIRCHYCNKNYIVGVSRMQELLSLKTGSFGLPMDTRIKH